MPTTLRTGRWVPTRRAALGMLGLAFVVSVIFGARLAWALAADQPAPLDSGAARASPAGSGRTGTSPGSGSSGATGSTDPAQGVHPGASARATPGGSPGGSTAAGQGGVVVVHVVGAVQHPGLVQLAAGSRVADAIAAAGGATGEADLSLINVARLLVDGEQIRVPKPGEVVGASGGGTVPGAGSAAGASAAGGGARISLNAADAASFDTLPGVGPVLAQRIVDWRTAHGRFTSVDELGEVSGIGEKLLAQLTPLVTL